MTSRPVRNFPSQVGWVGVGCVGHPPQCVAGEGVFLVTHAVVASVNKEKEGGKGERERISEVAR